MKLPHYGKPDHHFHAVANSSAGFLFWAFGSIGDVAYRRLKIERPEDAAEIRRQILTICFAEANRWDRPTAWLGCGLQSVAVEGVPPLVLGTRDAEF
jgi:hypothetical protein